MSIRSLFQNVEAPPNTVPAIIPMKGTLLGYEVIPLGVIYEKKEVRGSSKPRTLITPIAVMMKITWIVEVGILYLEGIFVGVGKTFRSMHQSEPWLNLEVELPEIKLPTPKVDAVEFINDYFAAITRSVSLPNELARKLKAQLISHFPPPAQDGATYFVHANSEEELDILVKAQRKFEEA